MVSYVKSTQKKPNWIKKKVWDRMVEYWKTEEAIKKSQGASAARNSPRADLGPHKHTAGPKSHASIQRMMSKEEGRPVSLGEVFIKTHTKKDGTFVDGKAKQISETYHTNIQSALSQASLDPAASDAASTTPQLTQAQHDEIFLQSTMLDSRGNPYGIGRLAEFHRKKKKSGMIGTSSALQLLEEQLKEAQSKILEQAQHHKSQMDRFFLYLKTKDPEMPSWVIDQQSMPPPSHQRVIERVDSGEEDESNDDDDDDDDDDDESGSEDGDVPEAQVQVTNGEDQNTH